MIKIKNIPVFSHEITKKTKIKISQQLLSSLNTENETQKTILKKDIESYLEKKLNYLHHKILYQKYLVNDKKIRSVLITHLVFNEKTHSVAKFKDHLIEDDESEYLKRFYTTKESLIRLPRYSEYYELYSRIFPNYTVLPESKFIYKSIHRKQKIIDLQEEFENQEEMNKKNEKLKQNLKQHHQRIKNLQKAQDLIFSKSIYDSIIQESEDLYSLLFGIDKYNNIHKNKSDELKNQLTCQSLNKIIYEIDKYRDSDIVNSINNPQNSNNNNTIINNNDTERKNKTTSSITKQSTKNTSINKKMQKSSKIIKNFIHDNIKIGLRKNINFLNKIKDKNSSNTLNNSINKTKKKLLFIDNSIFSYLNNMNKNPQNSIKKIISKNKIKIRVNTRLMGETTERKNNYYLTDRKINKTSKIFDAHTERSIGKNKTIRKLLTSGNLDLRKGQRLLYKTKRLYKNISNPKIQNLKEKSTISFVTNINNHYGVNCLTERDLATNNNNKITSIISTNKVRNVLDYKKRPYHKVNVPSAINLKSRLKTESNLNEEKIKNKFQITQIYELIDYKNKNIVLSNKILTPGKNNLNQNETGYKKNIVQTEVIRLKNLNKGIMQNNKFYGIKSESKREKFIKKIKSLNFHNNNEYEKITFFTNPNSIKNSKKCSPNKEYFQTLKNLTEQIKCHTTRNIEKIKK